MISRFPDGHTPPRNRQAALLHAGGHAAVGARARGSVSAFAGAARPPAHTSRPGPQPTSTRQATAVLVRNARVKQAACDLVAECQREVERLNREVARQAASLRFEQVDYELHKNDRDVSYEAIQVPDTFRQVDVVRFHAGHLWVYATVGRTTGWGDHDYYVYNERTGVIVGFEPESALRGEARHRYGSWADQGRATASGTGEFGRVYRNTLGVIVAGGGGAMALEAGGYIWLMEEGLPAVSRVAMRVYQVGKPIAQAYGRKVLDGMAARVATDGVVQLVSGAATGHGSLLERGQQALYGLNYTSLAGSALVNTEGLKVGARVLITGGTAAVTSGVSVSAANYFKYGNPLHVVELKNRHQVIGYAGSIAWSMLFDQTKDMGAEKVGEKLAERFVKTTTLRQVVAKRVSLGSSAVLGTALEVPKKTLETWWDELGEQAKDKPKVSPVGPRGPISNKHK